MKNNWLMIILFSLVFGGIGFFAGIKYQQNKQVNNLRNFGFRQQNLLNNRQRVNNNRLSFRPVAGEIAEIDDKSITIKLNNGSSKIVFYSEKTEVNRTEKANIKDLSKGEKVVVFGEEDRSGSINAISIQINPNFISK